MVAPLADPQRVPTTLPSSSTLSDGTLPVPFLPSQVMHTMSSVRLSNQIVGRVSDWIDLDAEDSMLAEQSAAAMAEELAWAGHLTVQACMLPPPPQGCRCANYARAIAQAALSGTAGSSLWLRIPVALPTRNDSSTTQPVVPAEDPWEWWNTVRFACDHRSCLGVALEVGLDIPLPETLARWWGEPVKAVMLRTESFVTNRRGYPTLSKRHQEFIVEAFHRNVQIVLAGPSKHSLSLGQAPQEVSILRPTNSYSEEAESDKSFDVTDIAFPRLDAAAASGLKATQVADSHPLRVYWEYLSYLFRKQPAMGDQAILEMPYRDLLQSPLQPLQDNLESQTYETFERDATKYETYAAAVALALVDIIPTSHSSNDQAAAVIMVVGAGRGPLVSASLAAATSVGRNVRIWAVEKNPNAVVHLHARAAAEQWDQHVKIVHADMRHWKAPEAADILVSELLGSFSDNELSPECLDGAQRFLRPGGISIPQSYTSYLHPVTAHKLWVHADAYGDREHLETPYVVNLHRVAPLADTLPVFSFSHPNTSAVIDNSRSITLEFPTTHPKGTVCHGFAGYFDAQLYKGVHLSTVPGTATLNMFSWFPIYFPIRQPFYVHPGAKIALSMWRRCGPHRVWYEWAVLGPMAGPIHNPNGRSNYVGL